MTELRPRRLPGILGEIEDSVGREAALKIAAAKGGREKVHFPSLARLSSDHWLVEAVGVEAARCIAKQLGSLKFDIPMVRDRASHRALKTAFEAQLSTGDAAEMAGVSQRTARRFRAKMMGHDR